MEPPVSKKLLRRVVLVGVALAGAILVLPISKWRHATVTTAERQTSEIPNPHSQPSSGGMPSPNTKASEGLSPESAKIVETAKLTGAIEETFNQLRADRTPTKSLAYLDILKEKLLKAGSRSEAADAIVNFLRSGRDAATGLAFRVGPRHALTEAPTLRAALLDWHGFLDPVGAAELAREILEATASPEEYALALRNFARGRPDQRAELRDYFNRMLTHAPWMHQPTGGFLESFDIAPHLGDPAFVSPLGSLLTPSAPTTLRHASLVALDRLVIANPTGALAEVVRNEALREQPLVRASFLARVDIRHPGQREILERYLLSAALSDRELEKFIGLFPNANRFLSYNLLTDSAGCALGDLAALDAAALEQVRTWQTQPRFSRLEPRLKQLEHRLREQVAGATRGGYLPRK